MLSDFDGLADGEGDGEADGDGEAPGLGEGDADGLGLGDGDGSGTSVTVMETVAVFESTCPSFALKVKLSEPL